MCSVSLSGASNANGTIPFSLRKLRFEKESPFLILHAELALFLDIEFTFLRQHFAPLRSSWACREKRG